MASLIPTFSVLLDWLSGDTDITVKIIIRRGERLSFKGD
jgi:hypothetical protein